jgi:broad specificity phosphatase PhoE
MKQSRSIAGLVRLGILVLVLWVGLLPAVAAAAVFVVRHAEKQTEENGKEVPLSEAGRARAARIAAILRDAKIVAIYSTDTVRTLATAEPLAKSVRIAPALYEASGPDAMKALAERIRREHASDNVLVVGHSNTVGPLLQALGCTEPVEVKGQEYDGLWVVVPAAVGDAPVLLRLRQ